MGPKKASVQFFEIFPLSELVFTYDKLNFYTHTHKKTSVIDTLSPNFELLIFSIQTQGINFLDRPLSDAILYQTRGLASHVIEILCLGVNQKLLKEFTLDQNMQRSLRAY